MAVILPLVLPGQIEIQGHRGWRGHYPENTIGGFLKALELGVDVLELDVVISRDRRVVISHEPWMNPEICLAPDGTRLRKKSRINLYDLTLEEIQLYDCGMTGHPRFPDQQSTPAVKPGLLEAIQAIESWAVANHQPPVLYNIEIKRQKRWDGKYTPPYREFADLVLAELRQTEVTSRCVIQSFDKDVLEYLHRKAPDIKLAYLVERGRLANNLKKLSFQPDIYSPKYTLLDLPQIITARDKGMAVIPWTVNDEQSIRRVAGMGVDGIISDYPERVMLILQRN